MLLLVETAAGYGLFRVAEKKLNNLEDADIEALFTDADSAAKVAKLVAFSQFKDQAAAMQAMTALQEPSLDKSLAKFLKKNIVGEGLQEQLAVADKALGGLIKEKFDIPCIYTPQTQELLRGIRLQLVNLVSGLEEDQVRHMELALAHSVSRFKLKFSPEKVDTMVIAAIGLLDDLDKELNNFSMRLREWYGWHFPELDKIVTDGSMYAKVVLTMGMRTDAKNVDMSDFLAEEVEEEVKTAAERSMGTPVTDEDLANIQELAKRVGELQSYRSDLADYLKQRMCSIAPNLTYIVGELIGARLISHAGSLMNLSKHPSSTVQILGAEKALFRALKAKKATPKYGLIFHAGTVGQAAPKNKGKISRVLAAKMALCIRVDALGTDTDATIGMEHREYVETRLRQIESGHAFGRGLAGKANGAPAKHVSSKAATKSGTSRYDADGDAAPKAKKRAREASEDEEEDEEEEVKPKAKKKRSE